MKQIEVGGTELLKMTKASKTQLNYWIRSGAVVPEVNAHGSGSRRIYNSRNISEVAICKELNKFGLSPVIMKVALDELRGPCVWMDEGKILLYGNFSGNESSSVVGGETLNYWDFIKEFPSERLIMAVEIGGNGDFCVRLNDMKTLISILARPLLSLVLIDLAGIKMELGLR